MKKMIIFLLCATLAAAPALAESTTISDVLSIWEAQEYNRAAFSTLDTMAKDGSHPISTQTLLRILITCCLDVNPGTTCAQMADYEPMITVNGDTIDIALATHAKAFVMTLDTYSGDIVGLWVDNEEDGLG